TNNNNSNNIVNNFSIKIDPSEFHYNQFNSHNILLPDEIMENGLILCGQAHLTKEKKIQFTLVNNNNHLINQQNNNTNINNNNNTNNAHIDNNNNNTISNPLHSSIKNSLIIEFLCYYSPNQNERKETVSVYSFPLLPSSSASSLFDSNNNNDNNN